MKHLEPGHINLSPKVLPAQYGNEVIAASNKDRPVIFWLSPRTFEADEDQWYSCTMLLVATSLHRRLP